MAGASLTASDQLNPLGSVFMVDPISLAPIVKRLISVRHRLSCNPSSRSLNQQFFTLNLALNLQGYQFLLEDDSTCQARKSEIP